MNKGRARSKKETTEELKVTLDKYDTKERFNYIGIEELLPSL